MTYETFDTKLITTLHTIIMNPEDASRKDLNTALLKNKLNIGNFQIVRPSYSSSVLRVKYEVELGHNIEIDIKVETHFWKGSSVIRIGDRWNRKSFRLKVIQVPNTAEEWKLEKDLRNDKAFCKAFYNKLFPIFGGQLETKQRVAETARQEEQEIADVKIQFPDFIVNKRYWGWELEHNKTKIKIELTKELDVKAIRMPDNTYTTYPDSEFMAQLITLMTQDVVDNN